MLPNPTLPGPTSANPRLAPAHWPDKCAPTLPKPDSNAGTPTSSTLVLNNPDTPEPRLNTPDPSAPALK
ncbi:hypothetical protein MSIMFI_05540 [Mycobacterium simulans]|nr:hypothetical protein MSIMFI_05540 [Mycobacterium simulans]